MRALRAGLGFLLALLIAGGVIFFALALLLASRAAEVLFRRRVLLGLATLALVGGVGIGLFLFLSSKAEARLPEQPLAFPHNLHAGGELRLDCTFCHRTVDTEPMAGFPAVEQCLFCHKVVGKGKPEVDKLLAAWEAGEPLNWALINRLPDHVQFDHQAHIRADVTCAACHGPIEQMAEIRKVNRLEMGDCLNCHKLRGAPTDCAICHY